MRPVDDAPVAAGGEASATSAPAVTNSLVHILVIEDDPDDFDLVCSYLEGLRVSCTLAADGDEGLRKFPERRWGLVVLDLRLPGMDGLEVCRRLRAMDCGETVPVLVHSRLDREEQVLAAYQAGATDFLPKSAHPAIFAGKIRNLLILSAEKQRLEVLIEERTRAHREAEEAAARAYQARSRFLSNMSHELRTPMNGVMGMAQLLRGTELDATQSEYLETLQTSAEILLALLDNLLDYTRVEAGLLEILPVEFDLRVALEELVGRTCDRVHGKELEFLLRISSDLPTRVRGDPARIRQVLQILIDNAIQFTAEGHIKLQIRLVGHHGSSARLRFSVHDTGVGISAAKLAEILQGANEGWDNPEMPLYGGVGISLTLAQRLVRRMDGEIGIDSREGGGSTAWFEIELPVVPSAGVSGARAEPALGGVRVLLVDDNKVDRWLSRERLSHWQMDCTTCADLAEATQLLEEGAAAGEPYKLVIFEKAAGGEDTETLGWVQALGADPKLSNTRLVLYTRDGQRGDAEGYGAVGVQGYLTKPAKEDDLREIVLKALSSVTEPELAEVTTRYRIQEEIHGSLAGSLEGLRVLVAEDNVVNQKVVQRVLETLGCEVVLADDGNEAVAAFGESAFDLVLMDCNMPEMDGFDATREIRRHEEAHKLQRTPVVALTADITDDNRHRCSEAGMDGFLNKPVRINVMREAIQDYVGPESGS